MAGHGRLELREVDGQFINKFLVLISGDRLVIRFGAVQFAAVIHLGLRLSVKFENAVLATGFDRHVGDGHPIIHVQLADARPIEAKVAELASLPEQKPSAEECEFLAEIGDNRGCMELKGASRAHSGEPQADRWSLTPEIERVAQRWGIDPDADLARTHKAVA